MARIALSSEEKESRKLQRRAAKKAARKSLKTMTASIDAPVKKGKTPFHLIEVPATNTEGNKKLASLMEAGASVSKRGYSMGHFIYSVPTSITEFDKHGTGELVETEAASDVPALKSLRDCVDHVNAEKKTGTKINKRFIKLMVRNSELKRNVKKETLTQLLTTFKIK